MFGNDGINRVYYYIVLSSWLNAVKIKHGILNDTTVCINYEELKYLNITKRRHWIKEEKQWSYLIYNENLVPFLISYNIWEWVILIFEKSLQEVREKFFYVHLAIIRQAVFVIRNDAK